MIVLVLIAISIYPKTSTDSAGKSLQRTLTYSPQATSTPFRAFSNTPTTMLHLPVTQVFGVSAVIWSPDASMLTASFSHDDYNGPNKEVVIWETREYRQLGILEGYGPAIAWSPDGRMLAVSDGGNAVVLEGGIGDMLERMGDINGNIVQLSWSPRHDALAIAVENQNILRWDLDLSNGIGNEHIAEMVIDLTEWEYEGTSNADYSPDGSTIATCWGDQDSEGGLLLLRGWKSGSNRKLNYSASLHSAEWSPDGHTVACAGGNNIVLIDTTIPEDSFRVLTGHSGSVVDVAWVPDGAYLASTGQDKQLIIWNVLDGQPVQVISTASELTDIEWSPNGQWLAAGSKTDGVLIWEPQITR